MWVPKASDKLFIDLRRALLPVSLGLLLLIHLTLQPPFLVMALLCLVFPTYLILEKLLLKRLTRDFDNRFIQALQRRDVTALDRLVQQSRLLRLVGPPGYLDEKRGLINIVRQDWEAAELYLERAYIRAEKEKKEQLLPSLVRVKYETGNWEEAEQIARQIVGTSPFPTAAELFLGLILCRREQDRDEAVELLVEAAEILSGEDRERAKSALDQLHVHRAAV